MIRSMTGFGDASARVDGAYYGVEIRSVNNRYFKAQVRLPEELQGLEAEIDSAIARRLSRGSIIATVRYTDTSANAAAQINTNAIQRYLAQLLSIPGLDHESARVDIGALMSLPGVIISDTGEEKLKSARAVLVGLVDEACDKLQSMRDREGKTLLVDLHKHCKLIGEHLAVVKTRVPVTVRMYQDRLRQRMQALLAESGTLVKDEDLLREVAVYAERTDIAEEVARLEGHLSQFAEIIDADDGEPSGRTLDFLSQELLREANTIASKCLDVEISRRIVEIKGAIDRIKEQAQNVE
ncbi:MAG: YicC family protein [Phycisphaerales bacterium]|nr:YicC family protein [Phycisphaerales bacterium]MCI0630017.1 YicC family protein [Phycisphaerales bacterium]MCI0675025.1 YicC family protein [Phycisphaerales bacterium]